MSEQPPSPLIAGASVVSYRIGGKEYPLKTVRRCLTCMSPYRFEIEQAIVAGRSYGKIAAAIDSYYDEDAEQRGPGAQAIANHYYKGHMPLEVAHTREIVEERARKVGKSIESATDSLVDGITLMETVVQKAFEKIASGTIEVTPQHGLAAAKMLAELGAYDGSDVDQQAFVEAFMAYHETAEQVLDKETFKRFGEALAGNPVLKSLAAKYEGQDIVEGEVVEGD